VHTFERTLDLGQALLGSSLANFGRAPAPSPW
jgi:hypothetical protein